MTRVTLTRETKVSSHPGGAVGKLNSVIHCLLSHHKVVSACLGAALSIVGGDGPHAKINRRRNSWGSSGYDSAFNAGSARLIPDWGTKIPHAEQCGQKLKA